MPALTIAQPGHPALVVVAAANEARAVVGACADGGSPAGKADLMRALWTPLHLTDRLILVISGVGKASAAGAVARVADGATSIVVSVGLAGALPGSGLKPGQSVLATESVYGDEGVETQDEFLTCAAMGFPLGPDGQDRFAMASGVLDGLIVDRRGVVATVSTCSGTDQAARRVVERTGALCEAMEGGAACQAAWRLGIPACELRVVSNTAGDRDRQEWDIALALERLGSLAAQL